MRILLEIVGLILSVSISAQTRCIFNDGTTIEDTNLESYVEMPVELQNFCSEFYNLPTLDFVNVLNMIGYSVIDSGADWLQIVPTEELDYASETSTDYFDYTDTISFYIDLIDLSISGHKFCIEDLITGLHNTRTVNDLNDSDDLWMLQYN